MIFAFASFFVGVAWLAVIEAGELPEVPGFEKIIAWEPERDRSMVVEFEGIRFKYEILDWKEAPQCQTVSQIPQGELRWVTHSGFFAHEYFTRDKPVAFQRPGNPEWQWMSKKTYFPKEIE